MHTKLYECIGAALPKGRVSVVLAMPVFAFLAVVGLVLIAMVVVSDRSGAPKVSRHGYLPLTNQGRVAAQAPAPDMTSPHVLATQPTQRARELPAKIEPASPPGDRSATTHQKQTAALKSRAALKARAEVPSVKKRVARRQSPVEYGQNNASVGISRPPGVREFGLSGTN